MNAFDVWVSIVLLTMSTLITRSGFFLFGHAVKLPPRLQHALGYAPAAAMAAIVMPDLMTSGGVIDINWANPKLLAGNDCCRYDTLYSAASGAVGRRPACDRTLSRFTLLRFPYSARFLSENHAGSRAGRVK